MPLMPAAQVVNASQAGLLDSSQGTEVVSTLAETTFYTYNVQAGQLGTVNAVRFDMIGDFLKGSAADVTITIRFKYGATTMLTIGATALTAGVNTATRYPYRFVLTLCGRGATNSQGLHLDNQLQWRTAGSDPGQQLVGESTFGQDGSGVGTAAEDSTLAKAFTCTAQWSASSPSNSWRPFHCTARVA
jgi:hypothetical protein